MNKERLFILLFFLSFWPVWLWYIHRMLDPSDEPIGFLSLFSAVAIALY